CVWKTGLESSGSSNGVQTKAQHVGTLWIQTTSQVHPWFLQWVHRPAPPFLSTTTTTTTTTV
ncbi:hypothetical protein HMI56_003698, partial [Coelomomyces lativittatus]